MKKRGCGIDKMYDWIHLHNFYVSEYRSSEPADSQSKGSIPSQSATASIFVPSAPQIATNGYVEPVEDWGEIAPEFYEEWEYQNGSYKYGGGEQDPAPAHLQTHESAYSKEFPAYFPSASRVAANGYVEPVEDWGEIAPEFVSECEKEEPISNAENEFAKDLAKQRVVQTNEPLSNPAVERLAPRSQYGGYRSGSYKYAGSGQAHDSKVSRSRSRGYQTGSYKYGGGGKFHESKLSGSQSGGYQNGIYKYGGGGQQHVSTASPGYTSSPPAYPQPEAPTQSKPLPDLIDFPVYFPSASRIATNGYVELVEDWGVPLVAFAAE